LNRVLGLGSAKSGGAHWWMQRITAVALVPLGLWFALSLLAMPDFEYTTVIAWLQRPMSSILLILTVLAVSYHSYLGLQVVIEDYVQTASLKILALLASTFAHFGLSVAALFAILKVAFAPA
jgi:succinate dehydrogenase / fumarate reductase membrane anchor subunit